MKRLLTLFFAAAVVLTALADSLEKMSSATQVFVSQLREDGGRARVRRGEPPRLIVDSLPFVDETVISLAAKAPKAQIADVETFNGMEMISAFVRVNNGNYSAIEALGAVMQTDFGNNLAAMLLPIDKIGEISDLSNVTYIEVAEVLQPLNDLQRSVTQAGDAISNSAAAQALGLTKQYTGKDVILGIIDTGVDFTHIAFKDKSGNSRIKRAYKLSGSNSTSLTTYSSTTQINNLTYDTNTEDHGTHTSTTAGGSSVIVNGSTVTVTDDHANATYGGMAPEADLVIAGLSSLYTTSIGTAIQNICNYADEVGKPCVISLSLGSQTGPHDGTGTIASIVDQCAGNNHIIVYAASNDGMRTFGFDGASGGMYASGTSTSSKPMIVNVQRNFSDADGNVEMLMPTITAYARTAGVATSLKFHVVNVNTGAIVYSSSAYSSSTTISVTGSSGLAQYFKSSSQYSNQYGDAGQIRITRTQDSSNNKYYWQIYCPIMVSTSYADSDGDGVYNSDYAFCVSVYPTNSGSSTIVDMWEGYASWFGTDLNLSSSSYNYVHGNDECSVSDNACYSKVISVGAYVTKNSITDYAGTTHDYSSAYPNIGDHASFSSWQTAGYGPLGTALPHINAPGARIVAGINHYHTKSVDSDYSYWGDDYISDLVVNNTNYPYAAMEGTSMATPCVSGIIAQWLQACVEAGKTPTPDYIKEVMAATWDTDQWTNGAGHGAKTFGTHGKINAIKGIQYILGVSAGPVINATPTELAFDDTYVGDTPAPTKTFTVTGTSLEGNITATLSGGNGAFALSSNTITAAEAADGKAITVTFTPSAATTYSGTVTLTSANADPVTVTLTGTGIVHTPAITATPTTVAFGDKTAGGSYTQTFTVSGEYLEGNISLAVSGTGFSIDKTSVAKANDGTASATVTVTFAPSANVTQNYTGTVTLSSTNATNVTVALTGKGVYTAPVIAANPTQVTFTGNSGSTYNKDVTVTGTNLQGSITAAIQDDANGFYSVTPTTFNATSQTVTVTWAPDAGGTSTANLVLTTTGVGANTVTVPLSGTAQGPTIAANPAQVTFTDAYATRTYTQTVTVTGTNLSQNISATLSGADVYSIDNTSLGTTGGTITVTYTPTAEGTTNATLTLSSAGASTVTVPITGTAQPATPTLIVSPSSLTFSAATEESDSKTFNVTGRFITNDVTLTLTDANGVFSIEPATIAAANISEDTPVTVTVTFNSAEDGEFSGSVAIASTGAEAQTVTLNGESSSGGTANDAYLNIAKYATIDDAGWRTALVNNLYKYTEYDSEDVAWLTLPVYGAFVGARYATNSSTVGSGHPQAWIECSLGTNNTYGGTTWTSTASATNPFNGSSTYFTSATARAIGYNSRTNTSIRTVSFYVTNCNAVKLSGTGRSGSSSTYPASLKVYKCNKNADGTVTALASTTVNQTSSSTSTFTLTGDNLEVGEIYKVEASIYRGYMYEIAFSTPLNKPSLKAEPTDVSMRATPGETGTATFNVKGRLLTDNVTVSITDANGVFSTTTTTISAADAMAGKDVTVSFSSETEGTYTGTVTLTSGSLTATVNLTGVCRDGGTATDAYLNIAKYATIDEAGATVSGMENIYKFTEYTDDDVAWLTMSNYGAKQADSNQNWFSIGSTTSYNNSWDASEPFLGSTTYFGSNQGYSIYGTGNQDFYVTNCTQVKAFVKDGSSGKATMAIYKCTEDANGNLTASSTAFDSQQGGASGTAIITSATLNASDIYLVRLTGASYYPDFLEIGFCTPWTKPSLTASPTGVDMLAEPGATVTQTITLTGKHLTEDVSVTLTDPNGVYSVDKSSISVADAEAGTTVTVTLAAPSQMGSYRARVDFTSGEATAHTTIYGVVGQEGTAYSDYLDISKYASIGTGNWYTDYFANAYKYTEDTENECAWLTVPAALPYFAWNFVDQDWCGISSGATGGWYGHQWTGTAPFQGYEYFQAPDLSDDDGNYARMLGPDVSSSETTTNTNMYYAIFNVKNCTQVKAYGYNNSGASSSYYSFIQIYELNEVDGELTMSQTRTDIQTSTTASSTFTLTSAELDKEKIYFVAVGGYRGFIYEVAFRTPIETPMTLAEIVEESQEYKNYRVVDDDLTAVAISKDGKTLYCKDNNAYASKSTLPGGAVDYILELTNLMSGKNSYDQSNWVALTCDDTFDNSLVGNRLTGVKGFLTDVKNPTIALDAMPTVDGSNSYNKNTFIVPSFGNGSQTSASGVNYFFVTPKPMEVATVTWAMWDAASETFVAPTKTAQINEAGLTGSIHVDFNSYNGTLPTLQNGDVCSFTGLATKATAANAGTQAARRAPANNAGYEVYALADFTKIGHIEDGVVTGLDDIKAGSHDVLKVVYSNPAGQTSDRPFEGVNIIVTIYNDGSRTVTKQLF